MPPITTSTLTLARTHTAHQVLAQSKPVLLPISVEHSHQPSFPQVHRARGIKMLLLLRYCHEYCHFKYEVVTVYCLLASLSHVLHLWLHDRNDIYSVTKFISNMSVAIFSLSYNSGNSCIEDEQIS